MAKTPSHYLYDPSAVAAGVVAVIYAISFIVSLVQIIRKRSWVWFVMLIATAMEVVGYVARVLSARKPEKKNLFVIQFCLIILAPVLMAGVIYVLFSRIVFWVVPPEKRTTRFIWVPPRFITLIFVGFDIVALFLQLVAAVLVSSTSVTDSDVVHKLRLGKDLGLIGVTLQMVGFGLFSIIAIRFHFASKQLGGEYAAKNQSRHGISRDWQRLLLVVNATCVLILIRSVFREVEFAQGRGGVTQRAEWYLYVFDTLPILLVVLLYNVWFPGSYLKYLGFWLPKEHRRIQSSHGDEVRLEGAEPGYRSRYQPEQQPGYQEGYPPGYQPGYQTGF